MSTDEVTVLVVDDNHVVRMGLRMLIDAVDGLTVVGEADSGEGCVDQVAALSPDVVLLDVRMPGVIDGVEAAGRISGDTAVLMLTYADDAVVITTALAAGAKGYLVHGDASPDQIVDGIRSVAAGRTYLNGRAGEVVVGLLGNVPASIDSASDHAPAVADLLTAREAEIMALIAQGMDNQAISGRLYISGSTLKNHITRIFDKLGVSNRAEAIVLWLKGAHSHATNGSG